MRTILGQVLPGFRYDSLCYELAGAGAVLATGTLDSAALAVVYPASGHSLAPCVAAHVLLTALVEPGLVLAAVAGEMGRLTAPLSSANS
ncbi:MAG: hypothetical protein ABI286_04210 [Edaphobacter sp.]